MYASLSMHSYAVAQLVEALRHKPEGRGLDFDGVIEFFHWHNPCRKLHNEELCGFVIRRYYSGDQIKKHELGGECSKYGREEKCIQDFIGET